MDVRLSPSKAGNCRYPAWVLVLLILTTCIDARALRDSQKFDPNDSFANEFGPLFESASAARPLGHKLAKVTSTRGLDSPAISHYQENRPLSAPLINGVVTNPDYPPCTDNVTRICNEASNSIGPGICGRDSECFNGRVCNTTGFCTGTTSTVYSVTTSVVQANVQPVAETKTVTTTQVVSETKTDTSAADLEAEQKKKEAEEAAQKAADEAGRRASEEAAKKALAELEKKKAAEFQAKMDAYIAALATGKTQSAEFNAAPAGFSQIEAENYLKNLNSSISAEVSAYIKAHPDAQAASTTTVTKQTVVNNSGSGSNVVENTKVVQSQFIPNNNTAPSSLIVNPYSTEDFIAKPGENEAYIQVLKSFKVNGINSTTVTEQQKTLSTARPSSVIVSSTTTQTSGNGANGQGEAEGDRIDSVYSYVKTLPQMPNFSGANIFAKKDPLGSVTTFADEDGLYRTGVSATAVANSDQSAQSQLLYNYNVDLNGYHPPEENQAYLQVLNAMHVEPGVAVTVGHQGLNKAVLKILTMGDSFLGQAQSSVGTNGVLINDLIQNLSKLAFTNSARPLRKEIAAIQQVARHQLEKLMALYKDHVTYKSGNADFDGERLERAANFEHRLNCIQDDSCDFRNLANNPPIIAKPNTVWDKIKDKFGMWEAPRHGAVVASADPKLTQYTDADPLIQFLQEAAKMMPGLNPNKEINGNTMSFINKAHEILNREDARFPDINRSFQEKLTNLKANLPIYENLSQDQFKTLLASWNADVKKQIDEEFTKKGLSERATYLTKLKAKIDNLEGILGRSSPADTVLVADLEKLKSNLQTQINVFQDAQNASDEQLAAARNYLKEDFAANLRNVDVAKNTELVRSIAKKTDAILKSDFGKSLNFDNLNFIVKKSIASAHSDFDQMKSLRKDSGFMIDQKDLEMLSRNILDEFQEGRTAKTNSYLDLSDFKAEVEKLNGQLQVGPLGQDKAKNAADVFIKYENAIYDTLGSEQFYSNLRNYVGKYYNIYQGHVEMLQPFFQFSNVYKTLTAGLDNPNALGNGNALAVRALRVSVGNVIENQQHLSTFDQKVFGVLHHLVGEFADTENLEKLTYKMESVLATLENSNSDPKHFCFCENKAQNGLPVQTVDARNLMARVQRNLAHVESSSRHLGVSSQEGLEASRRLRNEMKEPQIALEAEPVTGVFARMFGRRRLSIERKGMATAAFWDGINHHLAVAEDDSQKLSQSLGGAVSELRELLSEL